MYNPYQQQMYYGNQPQQQMQNIQQLQNNNNSGFVPVANEDVARNYPVAYGNTVIFKDENEPCIYIKKMGFSQLEPPTFEKYCREAVKLPEIKPESVGVDKTTIDDLKSKIGALENEIGALQNDIDSLKQSSKKSTKKKEVSDDE